MQENRIFDGAMTAVSNIVNLPLVKSYPDFSQAETVIDVGGGEGHFLKTILQENPTVKGILFDREQTITQAREQFQNAGLSARCTCVSGNFMDEIPGAGSIYTLKAVLHDWSDEHCIHILRNVRKAARNSAKVLIIDAALSDTDPPLLPICYQDLEMLCSTGGKVRTVQEFRYLLEQSGFTLERLIPVKRGSAPQTSPRQTAFHIVEGRVAA